jgi:hypothetical protein
MVATPDFGGETYDDSGPIIGGDNALGLVDFLGVSAPGARDMPDTSSPKGNGSCLPPNPEAS